MQKEYKDIDGKILSHGDQVITIKLNDRAKGGDLIKAYFFIDEKGKGFLSRTNNPENNLSYCLYKQNFEDKVYKI